MSYVEFIQQPHEHHRKTAWWHVRNRSRDAYLGTVRWHGAWRQFCFFPEDHTLYNPECLRDIADFVQRATGDYLAAKRPRQL